MAYFSSVLKLIRTRLDSDLVDKLNYYYTSILLVVFAILISAKQYVGYPIQCWVPAHFTDAMEQYTENYCWVQNTWWMPLEDYVPKSYIRREETQLTYYQWVPFILVLEALMFYAPSFVWQTLSWYSELDLENTVRSSQDVRSILDHDNRNQLLTSIATHMYHMFKVKNDKDQLYEFKLSCWNNSKTNGFYLSFAYLFVKMVYFINVIGQFFLLTFFLGANNFMFGMELFVDLIRGKQWHRSGIFPRVTLCDFEVKVLGNVHRHTVQCVLMINMFNEKIFLFLWFWLVFLFIATLVSLLYWFISLMAPEYRRSYAMKKLKSDKQLDSSLTKRFLSDFVLSDVVFVTKMISNHAGDSVGSEIFCKLYRINARRQVQQTLLVHSTSSGNVSSTIAKPEPSIFAPNGKLVLEADAKEIISFKENIYQPIRAKKYSKTTRLVKNDKLRKNEGESGSISAKNIHLLRKQRSWIGSKTPSLTDERKQSKLAMKIGEESDETDGEDSV